MKCYLIANAIPHSPERGSQASKRIERFTHLPIDQYISIVEGEGMKRFS